MFHRTSFALAFTASYQRSFVTDELIPVAERAATFYVDNTIATNGKAVGYVGPFEAKDNWRLSTALPLFSLSGEKNEIFPFAPTPYYFVRISEGSKPNHNAGILLSFLPKRFYKFDKVLGTDTYNPAARYKFKGALTLGYNLISSGKDDQRYFFVGGTFTLGDTKAKKELTPRKKGTE